MTGVERKRGGRRTAVAVVAVAAGACALAATALAGAINLGTAGGVTYLHEAVEVTAPSNAYMVLPCPGGKHPTGGGFSSEFLGGRAFGLRPVDGDDGDDKPDDAWNTVVALPGGGGTQDLDGYAVCRKGAVSYKQSKWVPFSTVGTKSVKASCPGDEHVVGGGVYLGGIILDSYINSSYPIDDGDPGKAPDDGWKARIYHEVAGSLDIKAQAICQHGAPEYEKGTHTLPPGVGGPAFPDCAAADHLLGLGGRLTRSAAEARLRAVVPDDDGDPHDVPDDGALVNGFNDVGAATTKKLTGWAICG